MLAYSSNRMSLTSSVIFVIFRIPTKRIKGYITKCLHLFIFFVKLKLFFLPEQLSLKKKKKIQPMQALMNFDFDYKKLFWEFLTKGCTTF